jgi:hypothetical protein
VDTAIAASEEEIVGTGFWKNPIAIPDDRRSWLRPKKVFRKARKKVCYAIG